MATTVRQLWLTTLYLCISVTLGGGTAFADFAGIRIVSVGDSYASGEGAPDSSGPFASHPIWKGDNTDGRAGKPCHRSKLAAPAVAADLLRASRPVNFLHLACSGSTVLDLVNPQGQLMHPAIRAGGPIDALIVSVGGNDIHFAELVGGCLGIPCDPALPTETAVSIRGLISALDTLVASIRGLPVPVRHVFITEYPIPSSTPLPVLDDVCGAPGSPNIPASGFENLFRSKADLAKATVIDPLNAALGHAVTKANAQSGGPVFHFVTGISQAFHGHGYCMGVPNPHPPMLGNNRMINTVVDSQMTQGDISGTMHPNKDGQAAAGKVIAAAINANVPLALVVPSPACVDAKNKVASIKAQIAARQAELAADAQDQKDCQNGQGIYRGGSRNKPADCDAATHQQTRTAITKELNKLNADLQTALSKEAALCPR